VRSLLLREKEVKVVSDHLLQNFSSEELKKNEAHKSELINLISSHNALLVVGSGSSKIIGYPSWDELLEKLRNKFAPNLEKRSGRYDPAGYADLIKGQIIRENREIEYHKFLERTFEPKSSRRTCDEVHRVLVNLNFKGIVTTNYDAVLESAIVEARSDGRDFIQSCDPVDLCDESKLYRVSAYLRSLSTSENYRSVLHVHGCYKNPEHIILTENDYKSKYGNLNAEGKKMHIPLDTLHRKVIWALLSMHSIVFVGFSMEDPFFMRMLEVVQTDLQQEGDMLHVAILPSTDKEKAYILSNKYCVQPIFYLLPQKTNPNEEADHSTLRRLIFEIADKTGVPIGSSSISEITKKMLER